MRKVKLYLGVIHKRPRFQGGGVNDPKRQNTTRGGGGIGAKQHRINEILCSKYEIQFLQKDFAQFLF